MYVLYRSLVGGFAVEPGGGPQIVAQLILYVLYSSSTKMTAQDPAELHGCGVWLPHYKTGDTKSFNQSVFNSMAVFTH